MSSSDLWGKDQYTLSNIDLSHPYGLTIVGNHIYWTDWNRRNIQRVDKKSGSGQEVVLDSVIDIMGLQGVDKRRQKGTFNRIVIKLNIQMYCSINKYS